MEEYLQVSYLEDTKGKPGWSEDGLLIYTYLISVITKLRLPDLNKAILRDSTLNMMVYLFVYLGRLYVSLYV